MESLSELCRRIVGTLPELCRNSAGELSELCWRVVGTLPGSCRNSADLRPHAHDAGIFSTTGHDASSRWKDAGLLSVDFAEEIAQLGDTVSHVLEL